MATIGKDIYEAKRLLEGGQVVASLGIFLPEFRFTGSWKKEIISSLKATAEQISKKLEEQ